MALNKQPTMITYPPTRNIVPLFVSGASRVRKTNSGTPLIALRAMPAMTKNSPKAKPPKIESFLGKTNSNAKQTIASGFQIS